MPRLSPLHAALHAHGLTQTEAARLLGRNQATLCRWAGGKRSLPEQWPELLAPLGLTRAEVAAIKAWQRRRLKGRRPPYRVVRNTGIDMNVSPQKT